jgi:ADP-ribose pyrophosphatase
VPEPVESRVVYHGRVVRLEIETWPGFGPYEMVKHLGAAAVLPITPDGDVLLVRQFRPAIRRSLTEIPAGILDRDDEDALSCAARELFEETGYRHETIEFLGGFYPSAGFTDEYIHIFWARTRPEQEAAPAGDPDEDLELVPVPLEEIVAAARSGRVRDAKTALAVLMFDAREPAG